MLNSLERLNDGIIGAKREGLLYADHGLAGVARAQVKNARATMLRSRQSVVVSGGLGMSQMPCPDEMRRVFHNFSESRHEGQG